MFKEKYKQIFLESTKVAGVGRGERAGGDHGEVQDGGWEVGVVGIVFKVKAMIW